MGLLVWMIAVNLMLAIFNLIPLGPLDGHWILDHSLPYEQKMRYRRFNQYGIFVLFGIMFFFPEVLEVVIFRPALFVTGILVGA
jgi:Zn-dependent protease